jgi:hypothetical protein
MSSQPVNTGIPYLINQNLFNTLDFLTAAGNLNSLVQTFPNEICLAYLYNYTKSTNDPVSAQALFFKEINKNLLKLKNNFKCSKNPFVKQYNFIRDSLNIGKNEEITTDSVGNNLTRINPDTGNLEILVNNILDKNNTRFVEVLTNVTEDVNAVLETVQDDYGESSLSQEFLLYWIDVFNTSLDAVKEEYRKIDPEYEKGIFQTLSDSIRLFTRYKENFDVVNGPLSDPYYENNQLLPRHYPAFIGDKLDDEFQKLFIEFSQKTSYVHRHNLQGIYTNPTVIYQSTVAHGNDLVTDDKYYEYIGNINDSLLGAVNNYLDIGSKIFEYRVLVGLSTDGNRQEITKAIINKIVQNTVCEVDYFQQLFQNIQNQNTTKAMLSV